MAIIISLIINVIQLIVIVISNSSDITELLSRKERMKRRILKKLSELSNANEYKIFIPVGELGDTLIQKHNPIFRKRFCEIFLESIKELDEKESIIIDSSELPIISSDLNKPIEYPPKYHSNHFIYRSLRRIDPNEYVGLNNAECRKYIESCKSAAKRHSIQTADFF